MFLLTNAARSPKRYGMLRTYNDVEKILTKVKGGFSPSPRFDKAGRERERAETIFGRVWNENVESERAFSGINVVYVHGVGLGVSQRWQLRPGAVSARPRP